MARISRNLEGVAREKATFDSWVALKRQECRDMAEAAELCLKGPAPESTPLSKASPASMQRRSRRRQRVNGQRLAERRHTRRRTGPRTLTSPLLTAGFTLTL